MIKAVFFDIDGTLVPWKSGRIPASVFESVAALRRKGILCFVATGRSPFEISAGHLIDGLDFDGYLLNNGELGVDADGTVFYRCPVDPDDLARLLDWVEARGLSCWMVSEKQCAINRLTPAAAQALEDAPAALGMAVCGAAMWMLIGAFMKPYARTAAEIVAALNTGGPPEGGYSPHTAWMVNCYINMHPAFFLLFALLWLILGAACLGGGGYLLASEIGYPSPHIPSLVMGAGLFTLGVAPAVMGLVYIVEGLSGLGKGRRKPDK